MSIIKSKAILKQIKPLTDSVSLFTFELDQEIIFHAGQFINLSFEHENKNYIKPYSIASPPQSRKNIDLCIKKIETGKTTPILFNKKVGDIFHIHGPLGLFTTKDSLNHILCIATGTGIAPFRSIIADLIQTDSQKQITLLLGVRHENHILFQREWEELERLSPNFRFIPMVSKPSEEWEGRRGYVQHNLPVFDVLNTTVLICGLSPMIQAVEQELLQRGVPQEHIHYEKFGN
jgi:ferredoxin-NADP reductase